MVDLAANLQRVRERIAAAAQRSGRDASDITLIAVSKTRPAGDIAAAAQAGASHFGENYVQELVSKHETLAAPGLDLDWHFIGHLQRNKVRFLTPFCSLIHVVDSLRLAEEIDRRAEHDGRRQPILLQVDLAGEETKFGCPEYDLRALAEGVAPLRHVECQGLMTIPPLAEDPEQVRPLYRRLRALRDDLARAMPQANLHHLSMGMSNDYELAIEEGATLVRVGTAIFGPRH